MINFQILVLHVGLGPGELRLRKKNLGNKYRESDLFGCRIGGDNLARRQGNLVTVRFGIRKKEKPLRVTQVERRNLTLNTWHVINPEGKCSQLQAS